MEADEVPKEVAAKKESKVQVKAEAQPACSDD
jgi:hypothetical protein